MCYKIKIIDNKEEILKGQLFRVSNYQWNSVITPPTYGTMAYIPGQGIYIEMNCEESNPRRKCQNHKEDVYTDSAMEVFIAFVDKGTPITNDSFYLNFEVNANGAMHAKYGYGKPERQFISEEMYRKSQVSAAISEGKWSISLIIPEEFLMDICGWDYRNPDKDLYCNFYKIAECEGIEHFGSFHPIDSPIPNFHLPVCFKKTELEERDQL